MATSTPGTNSTYDFYKSNRLTRGEMSDVTTITHHVRSHVDFKAFATPPDIANLFFIVRVWDEVYAPLDKCYGLFETPYLPYVPKSAYDLAAGLHAIFIDKGSIPGINSITAHDYKIVISLGGISPLYKNKFQSSAGVEPWVTPSNTVPVEETQAIPLSMSRNRFELLGDDDLYNSIDESLPLGADKDGP